MKGAWFMMNKFVWTAVLMCGVSQSIWADPTQSVGSVWGHNSGGLDGLDFGRDFHL